MRLSRIIAFFFLWVVLNKIRFCKHNKWSLHTQTAHKIKFFFKMKRVSEWFTHICHCDAISIFRNSMRLKNRAFDTMAQCFVLIHSIHKYIELTNRRALKESKTRTKTSTKITTDCITSPSISSSPTSLTIAIYSSHHSPTSLIIAIHSPHHSLSPSPLIRHTIHQHHSSLPFILHITHRHRHLSFITPLTIANNSSHHSPTFYMYIQWTWKHFVTSHSKRHTKLNYTNQNKVSKVISPAVFVNLNQHFIIIEILTPLAIGLWI